MIIYRIRCMSNGKSYVGQTTKSLSRRWTEHKCDAKHGHDSLLCRAIRHHGVESFEVSTLEECHDFAQLDDREKHWIAILHAHGENGYNCTNGGQGAHGYRHSLETRARMSASLRGRTFSDEHKQNLSTAHTGRKHSEETKEICREAARKQTHSAERRRKIAESNRTRTISDAARANMSRAQKRRYEKVRESAAAESV